MLDLEPVERRRKLTENGFQNEADWRDAVLSSSEDVPALIAEVKQLRILLQAYRTAKMENDERFMLEREAAREEAAKLRAMLGGPPGRIIRGKLSNEFSMESEGHPVYVFLDDTKQGYDAWVNFQKGDFLFVYGPDKQLLFGQELTMRVREFNFDKFDPPIQPEWFNKGYKAVLYRAQEI